MIKINLIHNYQLPVWVDKSYLIHRLIWVYKKVFKELLYSTCYSEM